MPKQPIERRAGAARRFAFRGQDYRVGDASIAQHYELIEVLRRHVPDPMAEAADVLRAMGDVLTPAERKELLDEARAARKPRYVTRLRVLWDDRDRAPLSELEPVDEADPLTPADRAALGLAEDAAIGDAVTAAWRRGLRPDDDTTRAAPSPAEAKLRDALNLRYARDAKEITEQVGGWPPSMASPEAWVMLYGGPALPEALGVLLPPWNEGMTRQQAEELGRAILADPTGDGLRAFHEAMDPADPEGDEGDKSAGGGGPPDAPMG